MEVKNPLYKNQGIHVITSIFTVDHGVVKVLLIKRNNEPYKDSWALVGGTGASIAFITISAPVLSSPCKLVTSFFSSGTVERRATPPPGTIPSSTAARVAASASSMRSFFSFISTSVAAPTFITATPPASFASLSCRFSLS